MLKMAIQSVKSIIKQARLNKATGFDSKEIVLPMWIFCSNYLKSLICIDLHRYSCLVACLTRLHMPMPDHSIHDHFVDFAFLGSLMIKELNVYRSMLLSMYHWKHYWKTVSYTLLVPLA